MFKEKRAFYITFPIKNDIYVHINIYRNNKYIITNLIYIYTIINPIAKINIGRSNL